MEDSNFRGFRPYLFSKQAPLSSWVTLRPVLSVYLFRHRLWCGLLELHQRRWSFTSLSYPPHINDHHPRTSGAFLRLESNQPSIPILGQRAESNCTKWLREQDSNLHGFPPNRLGRCVLPIPPSRIVARLSGLSALSTYRVSLSQSL